LANHHHALIKDLGGLEGRVFQGDNEYGNDGRCTDFKGELISELVPSTL
jgi:hypothetical protein